MSELVQILAVTANTPVEIYYCDSVSGSCVYVSTVASFPYEFIVPEPYSEGNFLVKIIDSQNFEFGEFVNITPTPTTSATPTVTPSTSEVPVSPTPTSTPPALFAEATTYLNALVSAGGSVDSTMSGATYTLFNDLYNAGVWSKITGLYPLLGTTFGCITKTQHNLLTCLTLIRPQ